MWSCSSPFPRWHDCDYVEWDKCSCRGCAIEGRLDVPMASGVVADLGRRCGCAVEGVSGVRVSQYPDCVSESGEKRDRWRDLSHAT